jgi:hypothetical protein
MTKQIGGELIVVGFLFYLFKYPMMMMMMMMMMINILETDARKSGRVQTGEVWRSGVG